MVLSTGRREPRPSAKNLLSRSGMYFGWSCISCRQPFTSSSMKARAAVAAWRTTILVMRLIGHLPHRHGIEPGEKALAVFEFEPGVARFDAQKETVILPALAEAL